MTNKYAEGYPGLRRLGGEDVKTGPACRRRKTCNALQRADMLPSFTTDISEVLTPNRLGVRGAGATGALGAVVNG
jgi:hypothetical protein